MRIFIFFFLAVWLFGFDINEAKKILDTNNSVAISKKIKNSDLYFLEYAIKQDRMDILKLAIKNGFDFNKTDEHGNTVLDFSAFFLNKKAVKLLIPIINPNHLSNRNMNTLRFVLQGISQEYDWILYPKEKVIKMLKDDKLSKKEIELNLKLYDYLRASALKIIDILKQNGAKFELKGAYPNEITFLITAREGRVKNNFEYKLFEKLLDNKGKLFFYIGMNQFDKAKKFINSHPQVLKKPFFLDYPHHYFYVLQKDNKYCDIAKYMIKKYPNILYYRVTYKPKTFLDIRKRECFKKIYQKYNLTSVSNPYRAVDKKQITNNSYEIFKFIKTKNYKKIEELTKKPGWNFVVYKDDVLDYTGWTAVTDDYTTPFLEALLGKYKDKKIVQIMLKNGGYMSGWNEIHYDILKNKPFHLEKYKKWDRIYKLNEGGLLKNITPVYLAVLKNNLNLVKTLVKNGADVNINLTDDINLIQFAIYYDTKANIIEYLINLKKPIQFETFELLAKYHRLKILKFIKNNKIPIKNYTQKEAAKKVLNDLLKIKSHLSKKDQKQINKITIQPFKKIFDLN